MNLDSLDLELTKKEIPKSLYSLGKMEKHKYCLFNENNFWIFYFDILDKKILTFFKDEHEACVFFYTFLTKYLPESNRWKLQKILIEKEPFYFHFGNIWDLNLIQTNEYALVEGARGKEKYLFNVFSIMKDNEVIKFAFDEFSSGIWGIYIFE